MRISCNLWECWCDNNSACPKCGAALAEFTRERLEQIRQVEEEIEWLMHSRVHPSEIDIPQRVVARARAALAELRRGMK